MLPEAPDSGTYFRIATLGVNLGSLSRYKQCYTSPSSQNVYCAKGQRFTGKIPTLLCLCRTQLEMRSQTKLLLTRFLVFSFRLESIYV